MVVIHTCRYARCGYTGYYLFVFFLKFCVFVRTVENFSAEDKASGVKFCTVFYRRHGQGIFTTLLPRSAKSYGKSASTRIEL